MRSSAKDLKRSIKADRSQIRNLNLSETNRETLEKKVKRGEVVERLLRSKDWEIIEDLILSEGRPDALVNIAMKEEVTEEDQRQQHINLVRFGVVTRIINKFHLAVEIGEKAAEALSNDVIRQNINTEKKERPQSDRRGQGSPR
jgi:hypothetical protein